MFKFDFIIFSGAVDPWRERLSTTNVHQLSHANIHGLGFLKCAPLRSKIRIRLTLRAPDLNLEAMAFPPRMEGAKVFVFVAIKLTATVGAVEVPNAIQNQI